MCPCDMKQSACAASSRAATMSDGETTFECTKPRVPVVASYKGPGPSYGLPGLTGKKDHDPRSQHPKAPAYHFGVRRSYADERGIGPGPCYLPPTTVETYSVQFSGVRKGGGRGARGSLAPNGYMIVHRLTKTL